MFIASICNSAVEGRTLDEILNLHRPAAKRSLSLSYSASISIGRDCKTPIEGQSGKKTNKCSQCYMECALTRPCKSARSLSLFGKLLPHQSGRKCVSVVAALRAEQGPSVYAKLESNSEPERARVCQRVAVRASESQSGSQRAIESQTETGRDPVRARER